ncbi:hypothetical protein [Streptomyces umbrinus]|uniref:hypothetical protein n=1 Tax=Streptomyces umbrinus TaxID=67370 RepID=UPI0033EDD096
MTFLKPLDGELEGEFVQVEGVVEAAFSVYEEGGAAVVEVVQEESTLVMGAQVVDGGEYETEPGADGGQLPQGAAQIVLWQRFRQRAGGGERDMPGGVAEDELLPLQRAEQGAQCGRQRLGAVAVMGLQCLLDVRAGDGAQVGQS